MGLQNDTGKRGVTGRKAIAAGALIRGATQDEAAELAGVSRPTIARWVSEPEFAEVLQEGGAAIVASCVQTLAAASAEALDVVIDIMRTGSEYHRFQAAKWVLEAGGRYAGVGSSITGDRHISFTWDDPKEMTVTYVNDWRADNGPAAYEKI